MKSYLSITLLLFSINIFAQDFYFGADLSYVNEMEDCGVTYYENSIERNAHEIFADHGCDLVRLRLWHTPSWYDDLNSGNPVYVDYLHFPGKYRKDLINAHLYNSINQLSQP